MEEDADTTDLMLVGVSDGEEPASAATWYPRSKRKRLKLPVFTGKLADYPSLKDDWSCLVRVNLDSHTEVERKIKEQFPIAGNICYCSLTKIYIVTFPTAEAADKAIDNLDDEGVALPINVIKLAEYPEERGKYLEQHAKTIENLIKIYEEAKSTGVTVEVKAITVEIPYLEMEKPTKEASKDELAPFTVNQLLLGQNSTQKPCCNNEGEPTTSAGAKEFYRRLISAWWAMWKEQSFSYLLLYYSRAN